MNFSHRLNQYDPEKPEISEMSDCIRLIVSCADATVSMVQSQFLTDDARLNDKLISDAMDGILMDLLDIREVVNQFAAAQKKRPEPK